MELMSSCEQGGLNSWVVGKKKKAVKKVSRVCVDDEALIIEIVIDSAYFLELAAILKGR